MTLIAFTFLLLGFFGKDLARIGSAVADYVEKSLEIRYINKATPVFKTKNDCQ